MKLLYLVLIAGLLAAGCDKLAQANPTAPTSLTVPGETLTAAPTDCD